MENTLRERIQMQARDLFLKKGPLRVTMEELALTCGISKKTLYQYFNGKEDLLYSIITDFQQKLLVQMKIVLENKATPLIERLSNVIGIIIRSWADFGSAFLDDLKRLYPDFWKELIINRRNDITNSIHAIIAEGRQQGYLKACASEQFIIYTFLTIIDNIFTPEAMKELSMPFQELFENTISLFFGGILTEEGEAALTGRLK